MAKTGPSARALAQFEKDFARSFGEDVLITPSKQRYQVVSTGSLTLDYAMGCGGYIVGKITEIWGAESAHKTTLAMCGAANFQERFPNRLVCWIDMERAFDIEWAKAHGMDMGLTRVLKPENSERVSDMARKAIRSGLFSLVVLDSVGGMITEEENEKDADEVSVGTAAKVLTRMIKQSAVFCDQTDTTMIVINQTRANIGYGADTTSGGPWALKHGTTHKIKLKRTGTEPYTLGSKDNKETVGFEVAATVEKNRVAPPRRTAVFAMFNQATDTYGPLGIDRATEALTMGLRLGIIAQPSQGYFILPGTETKIHGREKVLAVLRSEPDMLDQVRTLMLTHIADQVHEEVPEDEAEDETAEPGELDFAQGSPDPDLALADR